MGSSGALQPHKAVGSSDHTSPYLHCDGVIVLTNEYLNEPASDEGLLVIVEAVAPPADVGQPPIK